MLAKGAAIGVQFEALLKYGLYDELARHAVTVALKLADAIISLGYGFLYPAETNLIIPVFPDKVAEGLHRLYDFHDWQKTGDMTAVRIVTSWVTPEKMVDEFIADLKDLSE